MGNNTTDEYSFKVIDIGSLDIKMDRNESILIKYTLENTGSKDWLDTSRVKSADKRGVKILEPKIIVDKYFYKDFKVHWGESLESPTNKRLNPHKIDGVKLADGIVKPGQRTTINLLITAKKFATADKRRIKVGIGFAGQEFLLGNNFGKNVEIKVRKSDDFKMHIKRAVRLRLSKPGKVTSEYENETFSKINNFSSYVPIVMATWKRKENFLKSLDSLKAQKDTKPILYVWNNNHEITEDINDIAGKHKLPVKIFHSKSNIGGFGRFYGAREISNEFNNIIFIDDDQFPKENMINEFSKEFKKNLITSQWAHVFEGSYSYWHKHNAKQGQQAHYLGTGGMVIPTEIFKNKLTFKCPKIFWFAEDLWISYVADKYMGYELRKSKIDLEQEEDGNNQVAGLIDLKTYMLRYLIKIKKWNIQYDEK